MFDTEYLAGGRLEEIKPFPHFTKPYTKGTKLEMFSEGTYGGDLTAKEDMELIGISVVSSTPKYCEDYVEVFIKEKPIIESLYFQAMRSTTATAEAFFRTSFPIKIGDKIQYNYHFKDSSATDKKAVFLNFHFLKNSGSNIPSSSSDGYNKIPTSEDLAKPGTYYNLIGTDESGGKSIDWNHKRYNWSSDFVSETVAGEKILKSKTPFGDILTPYLPKPNRVLELTPYNKAKHPQGLSVLEYIDSKYGTIDGQDVMEITTKPYSEMDSVDLSNFDAIFFSPADCNCNKDITATFLTNLENFILDGKTVVSCHDTFNFTNFVTLSEHYFSMRNNNTAMTYWSGYNPMIRLINRGKLTDFPFMLPEEFQVLPYHRTGRTVKLGDNWALDEAGLNFPDDFTKNYVWMTSSDNCVYLEAGHSYYNCNGSFHMNPLDVECRAIINALFASFPQEYKRNTAEANYKINIPENTSGGYVEIDMSCYTNVDNKLKPGACKMEIYCDSILLETIKFPQNELQKKYYDEGWNTIRYKGKLGIPKNTKTLRFRYLHTSSNQNAFINLKECNFKMFT